MSNDLKQQIIDLAGISSGGPLYWSDLVPLCRAHNVNLAIDNSSGDSDGAEFSVIVVTPKTNPDVSFAGTEMEIPMAEDPTGLVTASKQTIRELARFLKMNSVVLVVTYALGDLHVLAPLEYLRDVVDVG